MPCTRAPSKGSTQGATPARDPAASLCPTEGCVLEGAFLKFSQTHQSASSSHPRDSHVQGLVAV